MLSEDKELDILRSIARSEGAIRQRELAHGIGLSLGMTNAILRRLAKKGWLKIRKINNRNIQYIVSPQGMEAITRRSYRYFRRTVRNVALYKEALDLFLAELSRRGIGRVMLVGVSDLDFIVEHLCSKHGLAFVRAGEREDLHPGSETEFLLFSEQSGEVAGKRNCASLSSLFPAETIDS